MKSASSAAAAAAAITHSADQQVVLVGLGHTNVQVLIQWARMRPTAARLMCISDQPQASYSGMLPGVLAGQYEPAEMRIDLPSLCRQAGAELVIANWCALDRERRELHFTDHAPIRYDLLSIGIGSRPSLDSIVIAEGAPLISIKPMQTLVERLRAAAAQRCSQGSIGSKRDDGQGNEHRPVDDQLETGGQVIVVGGGAGGFEVASTLPRFFERHGLARPQITLLTRSAEILPTLAPSTQRRARRHLEQQGVTILTRHEARRVQSDQVVARALPSPTSAPSACQSHVRTQVPSPQPLPVTQVPSPQPLPNILNHPNQSQAAVGERGRGEGSEVTLPADLVIWLADAVGAPILSTLGLPTDERGFLLVKRTLQSTADERIFVVGDAGTIERERLPKAGVFAVRQGPILWENIQRSLRGEPLIDYQPQRRFLQLLSLGDGRAIASYGRWSLSGRWAWFLKDFIDRRFMRTMRGAPSA